jgi:hypothetical protein
MLDVRFHNLKMNGSMKIIATILFCAAVLLATVSLTSCTDDPSPGLTLTPVEFGGEHASLLSSITGHSLAYQLQSNGDATAYRIEIERLEKGESIAKQELLGGTFAALMQDSPRDESIDMVLAFLVTDPRREGDSTEITAVLSGPSTSFHKDIQIPEWDSMGGNPGTTWGEHHERVHFQSTSEPIVLWVWVKGEYHGGSGLTHAGKQARACMQLTLHLEN